MRLPGALRALSALGLLALLLGTPHTGQAQGVSQTFPQTGQTVSGPFLAYWQAHGGLAQQGYPISGLLSEASDLNGKQYTVQYFERAVFEYHPENAAPYDVLLTQLGTLRYRQQYPQGAPGQQASTTNPEVFPQTGHTLGGVFRTYWEQHGGLAQQGYPISDEFTERSDVDGKLYRVQYFERAVFELHPENAGTPFEVLLTQLGTLRYHARYAATSPATPGPAATATPAPAGGSGGAGTGTGCDALPPAQNLVASPACGPQGTVFHFSATGFPAGEQVAVYYTWPDGLIQTPTGYLTAGPDGAVPDVTFASQTDTTPGRWAVTLEGVQSHTRAVGYFQVTAVLPPTPVDASQACSAAPNVDGEATPATAPLGTTIQITGHGFQPSEPIAAWLTTPEGGAVRMAGIDRSYVHKDGTLGPFPLDTGSGAFGTEPGRWAITLHGLVSNHQSVVYFCLTR